MSARNFLSAREKNVGKIIDCLPHINQQKFTYRPCKDLPTLSANKTQAVNRNINISYVPFNESVDRTGTPLSDFFSESEIDTPDLISEESDSSSGSALLQNTAEASKQLADEWEKIERTLFEEDGLKTSRPQLVEECRQWRELHPQLRIIGKGIPLPEKKPVSSYLQVDHEEIFAMHYSSYDEFSDSDDRLSQSSTDVTPQNSPRTSEEHLEPKLTREKVPLYSNYTDEDVLPDRFCSLLQITPISLRSPQKKRQGSSILKSDKASSKWMKPRPDSSITYDRNSAKSFVSLDNRNYSNYAFSAPERIKLLNNRVITARLRDNTKLSPLVSPVPQNDFSTLPASDATPQYSIRKVSLPPLFLEEEKRKASAINSAKRGRTRKFCTKSLLHLK